MAARLVSKTSGLCAYGVRFLRSVLKYCMQYFKDKVINSTVIPEPFDHCFIENILPEDLYTNLLDSIPKEWLVGGRVELQNLDNFKHGNDLWKDFIAQMIKPDVQEVICDKYNVKHGHPQLTLFLQPKGYKLNPHVDMPSKYFTSIFYLPKDDSQSRMGTVFWKNGKVAKVTEFKRNSWLCFMGKDSWHSLEEVQEERLTLQFLIRQDKSENYFYG